MKHLDMDKMIADCKKKQKPDEVIVFGLGTGRVIPMAGKQKIIEEALEFIKKLDGFLGIHPLDVWHTILIFDTLNNAKMAKNQLKANNCPCGEVIPLLVAKKYVENSEDDEGGEAFGESD